MKNKVNFYIILFSLLLVGNSCKTTKEGARKLEVIQIVDLEVDKLSNYYTVDNSGNIKKYSFQQEFLYSFSNSNYGEVTMLDVTNPHKILVFYKNQQMIVLLDNTLSEIGKIELDDNSLYTAAGLSNDGFIWLFDIYTSRLIKVDDSGKKLEETFPISNLTLKNIQDAKIIDRDNYVIMFDNVIGLLLFNNLGFFERIIPLKNVSKPIIYKNELMYFDRKESSFILYNLKFNEASTIYKSADLQIKPTLLIFENNHFFMLDKDNKVIIKSL